jgi:hypothetical protein
MNMVILNGKICTDCYIFAGTGEEISPEHTKAYKAGLKAWNATPVPLDDEPSFSWSPCDLCDSELGGARHKVVFLHAAKRTTV